MSCWYIRILQVAALSKMRLVSKQIFAKLREAELGLSQGQTVARALRKAGVTDQNCFLYVVALGV